MCTYNAQPIITLLFTFASIFEFIELIKKNLLFRSHPRSLVYAAAVSLVLIGRIGPRVDPSHVPPPPYPLFVSSPCQGQQENQGEEGEEPLSAISCLPCSTVFSHGSDLSYMPGATLISDRPPFYRENTPVGAPEPEMSPPL